MSFDFTPYKRIDIPEGRVKQIARASDGLVLWKAGYINQVPLSIDTDGSIFNGTGYINGNRLSSSGALKAQASTVTTGFIKATKNDIVRMYGTEWFEHYGYNYFIMYDKNFNVVDTLNIDGTGEFLSTHGWSNVSGDVINKTNTYVYNENGVTRFAIALNGNADYAYIRISAYGAGAEMLISVGEEFVDLPTGYTNLVPTSIDTDGSIFNGKGYRDGYRMNSSGAVVAQNASTVTGFIKCTKNDVIRVSGTPFGPTSQCAVYGYVSCFDANKTKLASTSMDNLQAGTNQGITMRNSNGIYNAKSVTTITFDSVSSSMAYVRISSATAMNVNGNGYDNGLYLGDKLIVTKNQKIV